MTLQLNKFFGVEGNEYKEDIFLFFDSTTLGNTVGLRPGEITSRVVDRFLAAHATACSSTSKLTKSTFTTEETGKQP